MHTHAVLRPRRTCSTTPLLTEHKDKRDRTRQERGQDKREDKRREDKRDKRGQDKRGPRQKLEKDKRGTITLIITLLTYYYYCRSKKESVSGRWSVSHLPSRSERILRPCNGDRPFLSPSLPGLGSVFFCHVWTAKTITSARSL